MSVWSYIHGTITVSPMGRTQAEKRFILETALNHLPKITGSEGDMGVYIVQKNGHSSSCTHDEFMMYSNLGNDERHLENDHPFFLTQDEYIVVLDAALRRWEYDETLRAFNKWITRLAKRVSIMGMLVEVNGYDRGKIFGRKEAEYYLSLNESPSWWNEGESNWCERILPSYLTSEFTEDND